MPTAYFDLETYPIAPGLAAPPPIALGSQLDGGEVVIHHACLDRQGTEDRLREILQADAIVGHNSSSFDAAVILAHFPGLGPDLWQAFEEGRMRDTMIRAMLRAIALDRFSFDPTMGDKGRVPTFSLNECAVHYLGRADRSEGKRTTRQNYAAVDDLPVAAWPDEYRDYLVADVVDVVDLWQLWAQDVPRDETLQNRAAFALQLAQCWGMVTNQESVEALRQRLHAAVIEHEGKLIEAGILRAKRKTNKAGQSYHPIDRTRVQALVTEGFTARGLPVPRTPPSKTYPEGQVLYSEEAMRVSGHPELLPLADTASARKLLTSFVPKLTPVVNPGFNVLVKSGRTSCRGFNSQNMPVFGGCRECIVPRDGWAFIVADYSGAELRSWAQVCHSWFGRSTMGDAIKAGLDVHTLFGADIAGWDYPEMVEHHGRYKNWMVKLEARGVDDAHAHLANEDPSALKAYKSRKAGKSCNFGFLGGMGPAKFVKTSGLDISVEEGRHFKNLWLQRWSPEAGDYFRVVSSKGYPHTFRQIGSGRVRGGLGFTDGCNTPFQGCTADGAKHATYLVQVECYTDEASPLFGSRLCNFVHDELMLETPLDRIEGARQRLGEVMVAGMEVFTPDIPAEVESAVLYDCWHK